MVVNHTQNMLEQLAGRRIIASALASALADPRSTQARRCDDADLGVLQPAWQEAVRGQASTRANQLGIGERLPKDVDVAPLVQWLELPAERREVVHQQIFGLVMTKLCPSYETEYCEWKDATHRAQEMADIAGFYNAFGVVPNRSFPERIDHVSLQVEFIALLLEKELRAMQSDDPARDEHVTTCRDARHAFLRDHAGWWVPTFGRLLEKRTDTLAESSPDRAEVLRLVGGVAQVLCAFIGLERMEAGVAPSRRLISPNVAPPDIDDGCGTCTTNCAGS